MGIYSTKKTHQHSLVKSVMVSACIVSWFVLRTDVMTLAQTDAPSVPPQWPQQSS